MGARLLSELTGVRAGCEHRAEAEAGVGSEHVSSPDSTIFLSATKGRVVWL